MGYPATYPGGGRSGILADAPLSASLPSYMTFTRDAGSWSRQTAPALNGTTFVVTGTTTHLPRFDSSGGGRPMLLIEPTRTNSATNGLLDDANADDLPTSWDNSSGTAGTDWNTITTGGPHGADIVQFENGCGVAEGLRQAVVADVATYTCSAWLRSIAVGASERLYAHHLGSGSYIFLAIPAGTVDWTHVQATGASNVGASFWYIASESALTGQCQVALWQAEVGDCATSFTAATRADELCAIDPSIVGRLSGEVSFLWRPGYPSTQALSLDPCMHAWASGYEVCFDPADDKVKVLVAGTKRAESAALTFAAHTTHRIRVRYGAAGTQLTTDGLITSNATAWGDPGVLAPYLGSRAASANCRPAGYGDYKTATA